MYSYFSLNLLNIKESVDFWMVFCQHVKSNSFFNVRSMLASHLSLRSFWICTILWSSLILFPYTVGHRVTKFKCCACVPCVVRLDTKATENGEWQWQNVCNLRVVVLTGSVNGVNRKHRLAHYKHGLWGSVCEGLSNVFITLEQPEQVFNILYPVSCYFKLCMHALEEAAEKTGFPECSLQCVIIRVTI